jgi:hypothetical protein
MVWLPKLLRLPDFGTTLPLSTGDDFAIEDGQFFYGEKERKLYPPVSLLSWLIRHPHRLARSEGARDLRMPKERRELLDGSYSAMIKGLSLLQDNAKRKKEKPWYVFEGETQPDVFIGTSSLFVVIEGKRTEPEPTTHTRWMPDRHQMIRHLDCAWEIRGERRVVGFFIVEGEGGKEEVPEKWRRFASDTTGAGASASSLPHRGPEEQSEIASCFAGVTTWQRLCRQFGIDRKALPDEASERSAAPSATGPRS